MEPPDLRDRIAAQFSYRGERADIWRGFDLLLETESFLNLGYSPWYLPHVVGSSQRRLAEYVGDHLAAALQTTASAPLLSVGCGRGGPAVHLADAFGFDVTGVDLVAYNVAAARETARKRRVDAEFLIGDATALPVAPESMAACAAIDALVYVPDPAAAIHQMAGVLERTGVLVCSDLVRESGLDESAGVAVSRFADGWDMPPLRSFEEYRRMLLESSLRLETVESIRAHSVGRFRTWTTLFLGLFDSPLRPIVERLLRRLGLSPKSVRDQVAAAHCALPYLDHVVFVARKTGSTVGRG